MRGKKLRGSWTLVQMKSDPKSWLLIKHRDEFASERDILEEDRSVLSGLTLQDLKEGRMPPMPGGRSAACHIRRRRKRRSPTRRPCGRWRRRR